MGLDVWLLERVLGLEGSMLEMEKKIALLTKKGKETMTTLKDVQDKVAAEHDQVASAVDALKSQVAALQDKLNSGEFVTSQQLEELAASVDNIFTPEAPATETAEVPVEPVAEVPAA